MLKPRSLPTFEPWISVYNITNQSSKQDPGDAERESEAGDEAEVVR